MLSFREEGRNNREEGTYLPNNAGHVTYRLDKGGCRINIPTNLTINLLVPQRYPMKREEGVTTQ